MRQQHIGGRFDDFLEEGGLLEAAEAAAVKRVIAFQIEREMKLRQLSKSELAVRMKTSRAALERLLDPANTSVTLATLGRAATALDARLRIEFAPRRARASQRRAGSPPSARDKATA